MDYATQFTFALLLAIPTACVAWTIAQEEIFKELREALKAFQERHADSVWQRKLAYMPTCPYCLSHYVGAVFVALFRFPMLAEDWRGYVVSLFTVVLIANVYMTSYNLMRVALRRWKALADRAEARLAQVRRVPPAAKSAKPRPRVAPHTRRNGKPRYVEA